MLIYLHSIFISSLSAQLLHHLLSSPVMHHTILILQTTNKNSIVESFFFSFVIQHSYLFHIAGTMRGRMAVCRLALLNGMDERYEKELQEEEMDRSLWIRKEEGAKYGNISCRLYLFWICTRENCSVLRYLSVCIDSTFYLTFFSRFYGRVHHSSTVCQHHLYDGHDDTLQGTSSSSSWRWARWGRDCWKKAYLR